MMMSSKDFIEVDMKIINDLETLKKLIITLKENRQTIGFVPTMGYLHQGHLSLMEAAKSENQVLIVSVFVNPTQFGPNEDFDAYPRNPEGDQRLMESVGVDYAFMPTAPMLYPDGYVTTVEVTGKITEQLCGESRPGHFKGVTTIVNKLLNLVQPNQAYFGQKDAQQVAVIKRMVLDLNMPVTLVTCPIVREEDGLALSSRNVYLSPEQRQEALCLSRSLKYATRLIAEGEKDPQTVLDGMSKKFGEAKGARVDYVSIVDADSLLPLDRISGRVLIAVAAYFGKTRLIDNALVEVTHAC
jgi:pantoate--beta-alanine ligase